MGRTESQVVTTYPSGENRVIKEKESFGWELVSRETVTDISEATIVPQTDASGNLQQAEVVPDTSRYVKLHFHRDQSLPNISRLRELEEEYYGLPKPDPGGYGYGIGFLGFAVWLYVLGAYIAPEDEGWFFWSAGISAVIGVVGIGSTWNQRVKAKQVQRETRARVDEIAEELRDLEGSSLYSK